MSGSLAVAIESTAGRRLHAISDSVCLSTTLATIMATIEASSSSTVTEISSAPRSPTVRLRLKKPESDKKVKWTSETVDNEHMGKKKSKCCCIYEKPRIFGESSSEDEDGECGHCRGHKKKCFQKKPSDEGSPSDAGGSSADGS